MMEAWWTFDEILEDIGFNDLCWECKYYFGSELEEAAYVGVSLLVILCEWRFVNADVYYRVDRVVVNDLKKMLFETYGAAGQDAA